MRTLQFKTFKHHFVFPNIPKNPNFNDKLYYKKTLVFQMGRTPTSKTYSKPKIPNFPNSGNRRP